MAIRHRKNSLFYKTTRGAAVGDKYMSLIHTCYLSGADPFDYLTQLQRHHERVRAAPGNWMPWNYQKQLTKSDHGPTSAENPPTEAAMHDGTTPDG
jgi:transposase